MAKDKKSSRKPSPIETSPALQSHPTREELRALGKSLRDKCPCHDHAVWQPPENRHDPLELIKASNQGWIPELVPIRHGRMLQSPFNFYRGAALNMAADLAGTPASGLRVQACGDCHLMNFGSYATPERRVNFDINVMLEYASLCDWTLAHAHARSGEPAKISGYLGKSDSFDKAFAEFSIAYADQSERDHEVLLQAVRAGPLEVFVEEQ